MQDISVPEIDLDRPNRKSSLRHSPTRRAIRGVREVSESAY
jgi:hypothetical protein